MKMMKWALLGGAALAVTATSARADDLAALKAQIEALQSRVTQLEAQPEAAMPSGYSLMTLRSGQIDFDQSGMRAADRISEESGFTISVMPTADAAPVAEVSVSGEIRTALVYTDREDPIVGDLTRDDDDNDIDLKTRARLFITGKTDTAVGEVGGYFRLEAAGGGAFSDYVQSVNANQAWGWWKFAPNWQLIAGATDSTAVLQTSWDWLAATGPVNSFGPSDPIVEMLQLKFSSGPITFAIALEDPDNVTTTNLTSQLAIVTNGTAATLVNIITTVTSSADRSDFPLVAGYLNFESDSFLFNLVGLYQNDDVGSSDDWAIGGGAKFTIADFATLAGGAVFGKGTSRYADNIGSTNLDEKFWGASGALLFNLAPDTRVELGVGYEDYDDLGTALGFGGGIYWDPVSQATVGLGATYVDFDDDAVANNTGAADGNSLQVFFGTWLRFGK
jgi:PBP1b-binding outer membrane lipoprotein LpoB